MQGGHHPWAQNSYACKNLHPLELRLAEPISLENTGVLLGNRALTSSVCRPTAVTMNDSSVSRHLQQEPCTFLSAFPARKEERCTTALTHVSTSGAILLHTASITILQQQRCVLAVLEYAQPKELAIKEKNVVLNLTEMQHSTHHNFLKGQGTYTQMLLSFLGFSKCPG